jgi:hypothetical protein
VQGTAHKKVQNKAYVEASCNKDPIAMTFAISFFFGMDKVKVNLSLLRANKRSSLSFLVSSLPQKN